MHIFAAKPDYELTFDNNMPWFDHYIVFARKLQITHKNKIFNDVRELKVLRYSCFENIHPEASGLLNFQNFEPTKRSS